MNMSVNLCPARCGIFEWTMAEGWSQLQCACPCIQITIKITHVYLIVPKTVNYVQASRVASQV